MKLIFFFSSRRRHTRWPRDWSSDVCSSDLPACSGDFAAAEDHVDDVVFGVDDEDEGHVHDDESGEEDQPDEVQGTSALMAAEGLDEPGEAGADGRDRKSTRLNSSHVAISYAVFCVKKKTPTSSSSRE